MCSSLGLDEADVRDRIENEATKDSQYQVVLRQAAEEQKQAFEDYASLDSDRELSDTQREKLQNVTGVWFEEQYNRVYPYDTLPAMWWDFPTILTREPAEWKPTTTICSTAPTAVPSGI